MAEGNQVRPRNLGDPMSAAVSFGFATALFFIAGGYASAAQIFPRSVAIIMMLASLALFARSVIAPRPAGEAMSSEGRLRVATAIILTCLYIVAIVPLGFLTASLIYVPATVYSLGLRNHMMIWPATFIVVLGIYYIFETVFHTPLPRELLLGVL